MKLKVFSVYDTKSEAYMTPFFLQSKGQAIRGIMDCLSDPQHVFSKYPADFVLFDLGEYDDSNASFHLYSAPNSLGVLLEFRKVNSGE